MTVNISPLQLARLTHHRWALPLVVELHSLGGGAKFVQLLHRTGAHHRAAEQALEELVNLGLVMPNPGHGHPLRPEFVLTPRGLQAGAPCDALQRAVARVRAEPIARLKWPLPILLAVQTGAERFGEVRGMLEGITDRALAGAIESLRASALLRVHRCDDDARARRYLLAPHARDLSRCLAALPAPAN